MKFTNIEHQKRFWEIKEQIPASFKGNRELLSVAYIMASSKELEMKIAPYIHWIDGFDYEKMFVEESFSPAENVLVKVAIALYDNGIDLHFNEVFTKLNQKQKEIALHAANYRYYEKGMYDPEDGNSYIK